MPPERSCAPREQIARRRRQLATTPSGAGGAAGRAPAADQVRNVVLVGHSGSGKTSLIEALLAVTGTIQRQGSIEEGTTVSDFDEVEIRQQRSVNLTLAPLVHNGIKVNLLDTPGDADFTGDLRDGVRAADAATDWEAAVAPLKKSATSSASAAGSALAMGCMIAFLRAPVRKAAIWFRR